MVKALGLRPHTIFSHSNIISSVIHSFSWALTITSFGNASDLGKVFLFKISKGGSFLPSVVAASIYCWVKLFAPSGFQKYLRHAFLLQRVVWRHIKINDRFIGIGHLPHQKISCLPRIGDALLIIQQLLFKIFRELLAYRHPTPQHQPHPAHEPNGPSFTGFKMTLRNVQNLAFFIASSRSRS